MARVFENALPFKIPDFHQRVRITADVDKYKWKEDESVWTQKKEQAAHSFEVLFDGEFVCYFDLSERESDVIIKMLEGIRELFKTEKVYLHESMYEVAAAKKEAENKTVELPKPRNEAEELVAKVFEKKAKKKGKNVTYKEKI